MQTLNQYAYANGNPVSLVDPFGTSAEVGNKSSGGFDLMGLLKEIGHTGLDIGGLAPGFGAAFDLVNGVWYTAEGDWINAGLSGTSVMPFAGLVSGGGKLISKVIKWGGNLFDWIKGASKVEKAAEGVVDASKSPIQISLQFFAKKGDIKQIESVAQQFKMTPQQRRAFGNYVESLKDLVPNNKNFSYKELNNIAKEFLGVD